jgi:hypothetical protein
MDKRTGQGHPIPAFRMGQEERLVLRVPERPISSLLSPCRVQYGQLWDLKMAREARCLTDEQAWLCIVTQQPA